MRVQTEEWRRFIPGVRMYKGEKTLFYNGEKLWEQGNGDDDWDFGSPLIYDKEERDSWRVVIVLPGVEVIPRDTFCDCENVHTVIMSDTVRRIERDGFFGCGSLYDVKLSRNLESIGMQAFYSCGLHSIFIPPSCREIGDSAFENCDMLLTFVVHRHTRLCMNVIKGTALMSLSSFFEDSYAFWNNEINAWIKNINGTDDEEYALHRACSSFNPIPEIIHEILKRQGLSSFHRSNSIGISAIDYLEENPYADIEMRKIINRYVLDMMGEII